MTFNCDTCGLRDPQTNICRIHQWKVNPAEDHCPQYTNNPLGCSFCGGYTPDPIIDTTTSKLLVLCPRCYSLLDTCATCGKSVSCSFETDPSPIPPRIMKQVRQGNMVMATEVRNPERIKVTCALNCECYDPEIGCRREVDNYCKNYSQVEVN